MVPNEKDFFEKAYFGDVCQSPQDGIDFLELAQKQGSNMSSIKSDNPLAILDEFTKQVRPKIK